MRQLEGDQRIALSVLAFLSNCHDERMEVVEETLKTPMAVDSRAAWMSFRSPRKVRLIFWNASRN